MELHNGDGKFVVVGSGCYCSTSIDGETWTEPKVIGDTKGSFSNIIYANGIFVAVGDCISISKDGGETWTMTLKRTGYVWNNIAYNNGVFVITGQNGFIRTSIDGETWTEIVQIKDEDGNTVTKTLYGIVAML